MKYIKRIFLVFIIAVLTFFVVGEILMPEDAPQVSAPAIELPLTWQMVMEDGTKKPVTDELIAEVPDDEMLTFETHLPENISDNYFMSFQVSRQDVRWYIDGELCESYDRASTQLFGNNGTALLYFVKVNAADSGKTLRMDTQLTYHNSSIFNGIYYGDYQSVWKHYFLESGLEVIFSILLGLIGAITILVTSLGSIKYVEINALKYIGWEILLAAFWLVGNSNLRQLIYPSMAIANDMNFYMTMLLPLPLMIFMNEIQRGRYRRRYQIISVLGLINFVVSVIFNVTGIREYVATFTWAGGVFALAMLAVLIAMFQDATKGLIREYAILAVGIFIGILSAAAQIIVYVNDFSYLTNNFLLLTGFFMIVVMAVINTAHAILKLEKEKTVALTSSEAKNKLFAQISHEIRTPINAILGMNHMVIRESSEPQIQEYAQDIQNAGGHLLSLVNDILDFSKLDSGKMKIVPGEYAFSSMINDVLNLISSRAKEKGLACEIDIDNNLPSKLYGDDMRIRQVLVNLLTNAVKYTSEGYIRLSVSGVRVGQNVRLHFSVKDSGIGIKQEDLEHLFGEFERVNLGQNHHIEGTGLGLSISTRLLRLMDTELRVRSVYGEGSDFYFDLIQPIVDDTPIGECGNTLLRQSEAHRQELFIAPEARILVVDDDAINRKVFINLIKRTQVQVDEAPGGIECLARMEEVKYDIVFLDHMMPEMDGIETLHRIREKEAEAGLHTVVVALTANASDGAREHYLEEGFDDFLAKPIDPKKLEKTVQNLLPDDLVQHAELSGAEKRQLQYEEELNALPSIAHVDWQNGITHFGNVEMLRNTVEDFYNSAEAEKDKLQNYYDALSGDEASFDAYRIQVHSMKSSANLIGAMELGTWAKKLEDAARDGKMKILQRETEPFLVEWMRMKDELAPHFVREQIQIEWNPEDALATLEALASAFEELDIDGIDAQTGYLKRVDAPETIKEQMQQLLAAASALDRDEGLNLIDRIREELT